MKAGLNQIKRTLISFSVLTAVALVSESAIGAPFQESASLPFVSPVFGDNMVLQRGKPNRIWGWSKPRDTVRVESGEDSATATAGADGRWQAQIQPPAPGGSYTVKIIGPRTVELHDVLVGDVWICGGQLNMQFGLRQARNGAEEITNANYPQIRFYVISPRVSYSPVDVPRGSWKVVTSSTAGGFGRRAGYLTSASAALAARIHLLATLTVYSSSNHRNPKSSMHSRKSG